MQRSATGRRLHGWQAALCFLPLLAACASTPPDLQVTLLAFNDFHGRLEAPDGPVPVLVDGQVVPVNAGGVAFLGTLVHRLQKERPHVVVVGAGDMIGATPLASAAFHDEPTIDALGQLGLAVTSVGNHEFDHGRAELLRMQNGGCAEADGRARRGIVGTDTCMNNRAFNGASFHYLAANVVDEATGQTLFPAYEIKTIDRVKIAFIGLTLQGTPAIVTPAGIRGLRFLPEAQTVNRLVPELRRQGANAIVVLIHQGGKTTASYANDATCPGFEGEIGPIADAFDPAVDVVVSGHTHQEYVCRRANGRLLTSAGSYGRYLTEIDLTFDSGGQLKAKTMTSHVVANGRPVLDANGNGLPLPTGLKALEPDPFLQPIVDRYTQLTQTMRNAPVGRAAAPLTRVQSPAGESTLGDAVADAYLQATAGAGAVIAFTNPGGLRADILPDSAHDGVVGFGQLYTALPFGNTLVTMDLTGAQLEALLNQQWTVLAGTPAEGPRMLQVSGGLSYRWQGGGSAPPRVVPGSLKLGGQPLRPDVAYRVTVNSYLASGGDGFTVLNDGARRVDGPLDLDALQDYVASGVLMPSKPPKTAPAPRIERAS